MRKKLVISSLAKTSPEIQRQVFEAFELQIAYDKAGGSVELSATVSEAVADAFENTKALRREGSVVVPRDIAGGLLLATTNRPGSVEGWEPTVG